MAGEGDAKKIDQLDDRWALPEGAEDEKGADVFLYAENVTADSDIQKGVRDLTDKATKNLAVDAETSLENGYDAFSKIAARENLRLENKLVVIGGADSVRDASMAVEHGEVLKVGEHDKHMYNVHCVADAGDHSYNQDGLVMHYNDQTDRLNIVLSHGPQFNPVAENLANAAAVRAALELEKNPQVHQTVLLDIINRNVEEVAEELGESGSEVQTSCLQLNQTGNKNTFTLDLMNPGANHCIIVDTNNGEVKLIESSQQQKKVSVKTGDIVIVATDELVKALKTSRKESQDFYLGNRFFIESQTGTPLKMISDGIIREVREEGLDCGLSLAAVKVPVGTEIGHEPL